MAETASDKITTLETNTAVNYLNQLLNKTLRIHASDGRVFAGQFKCTDREQNVILGNSQEYRILKASESAQDNVESRFVGLIVIPGRHILKVEVEEFDRAGIV